MKQNAFVAVVGGLVGASAVALLGAGQRAAADSVDLKDSAGRTRIRIFAEPEPGLVMYDKEGKPRLMLGASDGDSIIALVSAADKRTIGMRMDKASGRNFYVSDSAGQPRVMIGGESELFSLALMDEDGNHIVDASAWSKGREPKLEVSWVKGKGSKSWRAPVPRPEAAAGGAGFAH